MYSAFQLSSKMAADQELLLPPKQLQNKKSAPSLIPVNQSILASSFLSSDATTAVTLASAIQSEHTNGLETSRRNRASLIRSSRSESPQISYAPLPSQLEIDPSVYGDFLQDFVNTAIINGMPAAKGNCEYNVLTERQELLDKKFLAEKVFISKRGGALTSKLKNLFIFLSAGKPIYSMHGDDDTTLGYSGLITTIVASFEEGTGLRFQSISQNGFRICVMNRAPLIFVAITKVANELMLEDSFLERQLEMMYNYVLAVLSRPTIIKNFHNRMNYDLRRILSAQDLKTLDILATMTTYGYYDIDSDPNGATCVADPSLCFATLLNNALQCARLSSTLREKIESLFLQCKRIKVSQTVESTPFLQGKLYATELSRYLGADLLFAFLVYENKIVNYIRHKTHELSNLDINTLLLTFAQLNQADEGAQTEEPDLWVPICLANFNDSGFFHCYQRHFYLKKMSKPLTFLLLSGNKNSFFDMKQIANHIISKIYDNSNLSRSLALELVQGTQPLSRSLDVPNITHFMYKRRRGNQFYMDPMSFTQSPTQNVIDVMHFIYLYSALLSSQAQEFRIGANLKKLTYTRWHIRDGYTGFFLAEEKYEFYCICGGFVQSATVIEQSLRIINKCERYRKRLFIDKGVHFQ